MAEWTQREARARAQRQRDPEKGEESAWTWMWKVEGNTLRDLKLAIQGSQTMLTQRVAGLHRVRGKGSPTVRKFRIVLAKV
jgi:hypothetical protein